MTYLHYTFFMVVLSGIFAWINTNRWVVKGDWMSFLGMSLSLAAEYVYAFHIFNGVLL